VTDGQNILIATLRQTNQVEYVTNIWDESPGISYDRQWPRSWNVFKRLGILPLLRSGLSGRYCAVTPLEHKLSGPTQHWQLAFTDQRPANTTSPSKHLANTDNRTICARFTSQKISFFCLHICVRLGFSNCGSLHPMARRFLKIYPNCNCIYRELR
jgi:hypothetical protein